MIIVECLQGKNLTLFDLYLNDFLVLNEYNKFIVIFYIFDFKWLHTGDIGCMNEEGIVYFKSRAKELIIRGGVNIYPVRERNSQEFTKQYVSRIEQNFHFSISLYEFLGRNRSILANSRSSSRRGVLRLPRSSIGRGSLRVD